MSYRGVIKSEKWILIRKRSTMEIYCFITSLIFVSRKLFVCMKFHRYFKKWKIQELYIYQLNSLQDFLFYRIYDLTYWRTTWLEMDIVARRTFATQARLALLVSDIKSFASCVIRWLPFKLEHISVVFR